MPLSTPRGLRVVASPQPFSLKTVDLELPAGGTVEDLMLAAGCDKALLGAAHVFITDREMTRDLAYIPRENWALVRPKPGMHLSIRVVPGKSGGGGGKNPLRTILTIAVMAAAFYVGAWVGAQGFASQFGFTIAGQSFNALGIVAGGVTTLVGNAFVNAVAPIAPPNISEASGGLFAERTSPTLSITGSQNRVTPSGPVTSVFGEARLFPVMRTDALPYTEVIAGEQYLRQLFDLGYGKVEMDEQRIGTTPLALYEGVEWEFRPGGDADAPLTLYTNQVREDGYSVLLTQAGGRRTLETRDNAEEATGDLTFQGLTTFDGAGNPGNRMVEVKVEYRLAGVAEWTEHATETITAATTQLFRHPFRIVLPAKGRYQIGFTRLTADNSSTQVRDECVVTTVRSITYTPPDIPAGRALLALRIKATNQLNGIVQSYSHRQRRLFPVWDGAAWSAPVFTRNPAWVALGILRLPGNGNAVPLADSHIDLAEWLAFAERNDEPDQNGQAMFEVDGVIDTRGMVDETVATILATARAFTTIRDGKCSVGWDRPQSVAKQMFTAANSWGFEYERKFIDLPHALIGWFINPANGDQRDKVTVYDDGFNENTASKFEAMEFPLVRRPAQVTRELRYRLAEAKLRPAKYFLNTDVDYLQSGRGDLVRVSNPIMRWGLGEGRIKSMTTDGGGNITTVTLDERMTLAPGKSYAVRVRKSNSTQILAPVAPVAATTETATLVLDPAIAAAEAPAAGDLVCFGEAAGKETVRLIVKGMRRLGGQDVRLELVDEAPAIHDGDAAQLPAFSAQQTFPAHLAIPTPPQPIIGEIVSDERAMTPSPGGGWVQGIDVHLSPQSGFAVDVSSIEGRFRPAGSNEPWSRASASPFAGKIRLAPATEGIVYEFYLTAVSADRPEVTSPITYVANHLVLGRSAPPPAPYVTFNQGVVDAPGYAAPADLEGFRISYKLGNDRVHAGTIPMHPAAPAVTLPFDASALPAGTVTVFVVAVDTSGNESAPAIIVRDIVGPVVGNVVETVDYRTLGWPGTVAGGAIDAGDLAATDLDPFIPADDGAPFVPAGESAAFIPDVGGGSYAALGYVAEFQPDPQWLPSTLTVERDTDGQAAIHVRTDSDVIFIPEGDEEEFIPADDGAPFIPALGDWMAWPGALDLANQTYEIRVSAAGGATQGRIRQLKAVVDVEDVEESFLNFAVGAGGTRLPLAKTYKQGVVDVPLTLLGDGGSAVGARVTIDGEPPGPLIETLSTAGAAVAGHVNAHPKGY